MAKQWASRVIIGFQTTCWFIAILLLLYRGVNNLRNSSKTTQEEQTSVNPNQTSDNLISDDDEWFNQTSLFNRTISFNRTFSFIRPVFRKPSGHHQLFMGLTLISIAVLMILTTIAIILARRYERRRYKSVEQIEQPPRYEDVVDQAPRYSSLDLADSAPN